MKQFNFFLILLFALSTVVKGKSVVVTSPEENVRTASVIIEAGFDTH